MKWGIAAPIQPPQHEPQLPRTLGLLDCTAMVTGIVIGSGIFLTPGVMARDLPSAWLMLAVWLIAGVLSVAGALTFAELAASMPEAGGQYVYLRRAYGPLAAFLFGWLTLVVYQTGNIAALAVGFAEYLGFFFPAVGTGAEGVRIRVAGVPWSVGAGQLSACVIIVSVTFINMLAVRAASVTQNILTLLKVAAIVLFVVAAVALGKGGAFQTEAAPDLSLGVALRGMAIALIAALWTFDGWNNLNFSAGEIRQPGRTIPRALLLGTSLATIVYLVLTAAYLYALPLHEMQGERRIAEKAASAILGRAGAAMIALAVLVSTLGAVNGVVFTTARVFYAMARDGVLFASVGRIHPRFNTPYVSLWLQCAWSCALALSGSYDQLITYAIFAGLLTYVAAGASVFTLRRIAPEMPRPYQVWGYPVVPVLFLGAVLALLGSTLVERPVESAIGLGMLTLGVPVYVIWRRFSADVSESLAGR